jgi:hypothetical protein
MSYIPAVYQKYFKNLRGKKRDEETYTENLEEVSSLG